MSDLRSRVKTIEKKIIPPPKHDLCNLLLQVWRRDGKTYYKDNEGVEKEFIQADHPETPILIDITEGVDQWPI